VFKQALAILILAIFSSISVADSNTWLLGNWQMAYDPDGDTKDILTFSPGGQFVTTEASTGRKIQGNYIVKPGEVNVSLVQQGKVFMKLKLTYESSKDKLFYNPDNTNDPAYYAKLR